MNMKTTNIIKATFVVLLFAGASCTRVDENLLGAVEENQNIFEITVNCPTSEDEGTRTDITGLNPYWKAGDEIWLSDGVNEYVAAVPVEYDGKAYAKLTAVGLDPTQPIYATYPYQDSLKIGANDNIVARIPTVQDGTFGKAHLAVGMCAPGGDKEISFKNASSVIKFYINREDLKTMQLQNTSVNFSGEFRINPETGAKSGNSESFRRIRIDFTGTGDKYISVMECNLSKGSKFTFITKDGRMGYIYTSQKNALSNGYIYDLGNIDDLITMDGTPAVDLSLEQSANCYIVNGGGSYRFKAVEGNTKNTIPDIAYADVVWETANKSSAPTKFSMASEVAYSDGYIYFRLPDDVPDGNVLLSACDEYGHILWSWHIWILKDGITDQTWPSGATMMDRNLGALSAAPGNYFASGMIYQWGRKDPFPGSASISSNTQMGLAGTTMSTQGSNDETGTIEYAVTHPTVYIYKASGDWLAAEDLTLWSAALKTKYDPCPPGYHIPFESVFDGLKTDNVVYDESNKGRKLSYDGQSIWFPLCGYRYSGGGDLRNVGANYYLFFDQSSSSANKCSVAATSSSFAIGSSTSPHASGFSIRCQKIVSSGEVNTIRMKYQVEDVSYGVKAPSFSGDSYGAREIDWGDNHTETLDLTPNFYHYYKTPGTYSLVINCVDMTGIVIPVGDLIELDLSGF